MSETLEITISTDQDYWGERPPTKEEITEFINEIKATAIEWGYQVLVNITDGDASNDEKAQELVNFAWSRWCSK